MRVSILLASLLALVAGLGAVWLGAGGPLPAGWTATVISQVVGRRVSLQAARVPATWPPQIVVDGARVGAPPWAEAEDLVSIERARVTARPPARWADRAWIERVRLERPRVHLELHPRHGASWRAQPPAMPPSGWRHLGELVVTAGRLTFRDPARAVTLELRQLRARARPSAAEAPVFRAQGALNGDPFRLEVHAERRDARYAVTVTTEIGRTEAKAEADVARPWFGDTFAVDMDIAAPSLADLPQALPGEFPATGDVRLAGKLARTDDGWGMSDLDARVGGTRLRGRLAYLPGEPRARLEGELRADPLDLRAGPSPEAPNDWPARVAAKLGLVDADLHLRVDDFAGSALPLERLTTRVVADADRLRLADVGLATAGGRIDGELELRRRDAAPALETTVRAERVRLGPWLGAVERLEGRVSGEASLQATGATIAAMLQSTAGTLEFTLGGGSVRRSTVELVGLDVSNALLLPLADQDMPVRCAVLRGDVAAGRLTLERAALGTPSSVLIARGAIDLAERHLDLRIEARAKDFSLFDAAAPVLVRGRLGAPEVVVGRMDALPLFELGDTPPLDCEAIEN